MEKTYDPSSIEQAFYQRWEAQRRFPPTGQGSPYCIMIPPPNVTGSLHMGHAFQDAIMDALIRWRRMRGDNTLWQVGTDHAGIATQMVVERKLQAETDKSRHDLGREAFTDKIWEWKNHSGSGITQQLRRLGASVDWESERFTMDEGFSNAVKEVFVRLHREGLIYRSKKLVNWDPKLRTAISDLEVINREVNGQMWYIRYPLADAEKTADGTTYITVATTRPETLLGDVAVAVNPDDERYRHLIGKHVLVPLVNRPIPVVADPHADQQKGTGCVKITPAHDFNDNEIGRRCDLPMINIMRLDGTIADRGEIYDSSGSIRQDEEVPLPQAYWGMERFQARKQIVRDLETAGLLDSVQPHTLMVPYGDRSDEVIEPLLTDQWFVRTASLAEPAIEAVKKGEIQFVPKQYENMYFAWMREIQDWCISRQLWWGHRIPAWYDDNGSVYVGDSEEAVRKEYKITDDTVLRQDEDVLDTWFSAALWSFATLGWPEQTPRLQTFHPTDVLVTGFDIIFFWVARMIMMSLHFVKDEQGKPQIPFRHVYVTGLIRDENGDKMSKSKGNVLDPLDMIDGITLEELVSKRTSNMMQPEQASKIEKRTRKVFANGIAPHGTDALRFTLYSLASTGRDINWDMKRLEGYRNFCNKLWNAANYVQMHTQGKECGQSGSELEYSLADRWIRSSLQRLPARIEKNLTEFRLDHAAQNLYDFIWNEYCAWYLELSKPVLWDDTASETLKRGTRQTLVQALEEILRLAHPFMPFITEAIWSEIHEQAGVHGDSIMQMRYPVADDSVIDTAAEQDVEWLKAFITAIRNIRAELNIAPGKELNVLLRNTSTNDMRRIDENTLFLMKLAKLSSVRVLPIEESPPLAATQLIGDMELLVPLAGLVDKQKESARLEKELARLDREVLRLQKKLGNDKFLLNANPEVVKSEREKLKEAKATSARLTEKLTELSTL